MNRHEKALALLKSGTVIPAIPLALDQDRKFDEKTQRRLVRYYMAAGSGGVAAAVHSTQFEIRDPEHNLFLPVLTAVISEMEKYEAETGKVLVRISGVCGDTEQACSEAKLAKELGDIAWYLAEAAPALDMPLGDILQGNIDKLKARYPDGFETDRSRIRLQDDL